MMLRAALPAVPVLNQVPGVRRTGTELPGLLVLTRHDVPVDRSHVAAYAEVCGFPLSETLPMTYPHLLAFPLHLAIMTDRSFPFPAIGTVHLENAITQHRTISPDEKLQVTARPADLRPHAKGRALRHRRRRAQRRGARVGSRSTYLRLGGGDREAAADGPAFEDVPAGCSAVAAGRRPRPPLRLRVRGPQPDPPLRPDRQGLRLPAADRARHVEQGALPGRARGATARRRRASRSPSRSPCCCPAPSDSARPAPVTTTPSRCAAPGTTPPTCSAGSPRQGESQRFRPNFTEVTVTVPRAAGGETRSS